MQERCMDATYHSSRISIYQQMDASHRERERFIPSSKETSFDRNHMFTQKQVILPWDVLGLESALGFVASDTG